MNNWKHWDDTHKDMKAKAKEIFVGFKGRDGMAPEHASAEFDRIHAAGNKDTYISSVRVGAKIKQNRAEKISNVNTFENAYNHAGFALTQKEETYAGILKSASGWAAYWAKRKNKASLNAIPTNSNIQPGKTWDIKLRAYKEDLVTKGSEGKHWHWHDHQGSQVANNHLQWSFPAKRTTHSSDASRFGKRPATFGDVNASVQGLHDHLTGNGFKVSSNNVEDLGHRTSQHITYAHADGTTVHSISNQPKDNMTELAHDVAVFHAPEKAKPTPDDAGHTPAETPHVPEAAQGVNHPSNHVEVANTILQQYGGNKFRAMTGANTFTASKEKGGALTFKLPKTAGATKGVKYVKTVHDPATDTYDVHMLGRDGSVKHTATGIYASALQDHFKHHTGLDTHL